MTATTAIPTNRTKLAPTSKPPHVRPAREAIPLALAGCAPEPLATRLLTKAEVCERMKVSERGLDKMVGRREFPSPVKLGKRHFWSHIPVDHWLSRKFAVQETWHIT